MDIQALSPLASSGFATRQNSTEGTGATPTHAAIVTEPAQAAIKAVEPSRPELDKAVKAVNDFVGAVNNDLNFSVDHDSGKTVVKVMDSKTHEVIKQFPSEQMLEIAKALDSIKGLLVQQKA